MAYQGQHITNPRTGQQMTFIELMPELLRIDTINPPGGVPEPMHVHPHQLSGTDVTAGALVFEVAGQRRVVHAGESIEIPSGAPHRFWNEGSDDATAIGWFRPALDTAAFFESLFSLADRGQLKANGMPRLLPLVALAGHFSNEIRPVSPPWPVLRAITSVLSPVARARGHTGRA
jgi:mannose-6-phosphate isomerase-like protein (cupin superfamily)